MFRRKYIAIHLQCLDSSPNIVGSITTGHSLSLFQNSPNNVSGAIAFGGGQGRTASGSDGASDTYKGFTFDASYCSIEYVNEASLQPLALSVLCCIKA